MVTIGKDESGRPIGKLLKPKAYFATYNDAYQALLEYNRNPYDLIDSPTFAEVYNKWIESYKVPYQTFYGRFQAFMVDHKITAHHKPHDGRKHFITLAKKYNVDEYAIKRIVGHSIKSDLTEFVYTERDNNWLYSEICKIQKY